MIDGGETDWKVVAIDLRDPLAALLEDIEDVERELPGCLTMIREWFRLYKVPDGKPENKFALDEKFMDKKYATAIVHETHGAWKKLLSGGTERGSLNLSRRATFMGDAISITSAGLLQVRKPPTQPKGNMMAENIELMNRLEGFDVVIVCTSTANQAKFWQQRLSSTAGSVSPSACKICAVDEDWAAGGAGNGLGTLYAFQKARALAQKLYGVDIYGGMQSGELSVGIYHTAGKGTRLAPIPGAENNNKPGVKLPSVVRTTSGQTLPLTILEGVIKQTGVYASSRKGRLSVFWGDQVFIPSVDTRYTSLYHADILAQMGPMPSKQEWEEGGYSNYGLIATGSSGEGAQVEKVTFQQAQELLRGLGSITECGPSLGSFSLSAPLLGALVEEFTPELEAKAVALDSDPHFWMPMTLSLQDYVNIMGTKDMNAKDATSHYARVQKIKSSLPKDLKTFGAVGVGKEGYWWDYGQVKFYLDNNMKMSQDNEEADAMRKFFGSQASFNGNSTVLNTDVGQDSSISGCVLTGVHTKKADLKVLSMYTFTDLHTQRRPFL